MPTTACVTTKRGSKWIVVELATGQVLWGAGDVFAATQAWRTIEPERKE